MKPNREFDEIFDSLLPELREDLDRLDFRLRTITSEAKLFGINGDHLVRKLRQRFWSLAAEVSGMEGYDEEQSRSSKNI